MKFIINAWRKESLWLVFLVPISYIYRILILIRRKIFSIKRRPKSFKAPIIVIGNLTIGGAGKTPLTIFVATRLAALGYKPGIVSRGYGGHPPYYPFCVDSNSNASVVGDEPLLIAERTQLPVVIDPNRHAAVELILSEFDVDVILSDDGLQHYKMYRDIEICVLDGNESISNGRCLPAGPLRESLKRLKEVDFIVLNGISSTAALKHLSVASFEMKMVPKSFVNLSTSEVRPFSGAPFNIGNRIQAVTAIANPNRFFETIEALPYPLNKVDYPDHYEFTANDFQSEKIEVHQPVVMTEKDAVKCKAFATNNFWMLTTNIELEDVFIDSLVSKVDHYTQNIAELREL